MRTGAVSDPYRSRNEDHGAAVVLSALLEPPVTNRS